MIGKNELNSTNFIPVEENISNSKISQPSLLGEKPGEGQNIKEKDTKSVLISTPNKKSELKKKIEDKDSSLLQKEQEIMLQESMHMIQYLKKVCQIEQPGSLSKSYFYNFNSSNKYKIYKSFSMIFNIINYFFGTFYCIISKPVLLFTPNKLTIYINYYIPSTSYRLIRRHN
jgi:hypothetical protein